MKKMTIGVVDYGAGNHASVYQCLHNLEFRCRVTDDQDVLKKCDLLLLPGVGAFRAAKLALESKGLDRFLVEQGSLKKPILGICLGMQLLAESSTENGITKGMGLIPGEIRSLGNFQWHIGWNTLEIAKADPLFAGFFGKTFYFNHSYAYWGPDEYVICKTQSNEITVASVIRKDNVVGLQFHPEKSQRSGQRLLNHLIQGLCRA